MICDKIKNNTIWISQTYCDIKTYCDIPKRIVNLTNPIVNFKIRLEIHSQTQTNKYNCLVFTQTGRKTIGMWWLPSRPIVQYIWSDANPRIPQMVFFSICMYHFYHMSYSKYLHVFHNKIKLNLFCCFILKMIWE